MGNAWLIIVEKAFYLGFNNNGYSVLNRQYKSLFLNWYFNFRDFRLILNPRKGLLDSYFKAYAVGDDGKEKIIPVGKKELK